MQIWLNLRNVAMTKCNGLREHHSRPAEVSLKESSCSAGTVSEGRSVIDGSLKECVKTRGTQ